MWIFHPLGFASVVADKQNPNNLLVRGRVKGDLEKLFPDAGKPQETPDHDYRYRLSVPRTEVAIRYAELMAGITYGNFKDACPKDRHQSYMSIWTTMFSLQVSKLPWRKRQRKAQPTRYNDYFDWRFDPQIDKAV